MIHPGNLCPLEQYTIQRTTGLSFHVESTIEIIPLLNLNLNILVLILRRRLEGLEYRIEGVSQIVADLQETSSVRESAARERATSMEKSIREISRNVQILRDKAELAEANSELAKIASSASERKKLQNKEADLELPPREETYTKNEASSSSGQIKEDQENFKEEPEKQTGTATRQESISDSKSVTESVTRSDTQVAGSAPYAPPPVQAPAVPTGQMPPNAFQSQVNGQSAPSQSSVAIPCAPPPPPDNSTSVAAQIPLRRNIMPTQMVYKDSNGKGTEGNAAPIGSEHPSRLANPPLSQPLPPGYASIPPPPPNAGHQGTPRHPVPGSSPNFQQQFSNGGANLQQMRPGYPMQPENAPGYPSMPSGSMPSSEYRSQQRMPSPHPPSGPHVGYQSAAARPGFAPYPQPPTSMSSNRKPSSSGGVPLEKVIDDVAIMGFSREEVRNVLLELSSEGKAVDLNIVLDRLGAR